MTNPRSIAVCISDIHFSLSTLEIASSALTKAIEAARYRNLPLIIAGDLHNDKAIIRAEIANRILGIISGASTPVYILVGNHDKVNEKGEEHALNYLSPYARVIDTAIRGKEIHPGLTFIPYCSDPERFKGLLSSVKDGSLVVMHQGVQGATMGDYVVDKSSIKKDVLAPYRCLSGHYHRHQQVGTLTYIGSPYTVSFGEANDGPKGFVILHEDGSVTRCLTNLRKHLIVERTLETLKEPPTEYVNGDLVWLKVSGPYTELQKLNKVEIGKNLFGHANYKLDKVYTDAPKLEETQTKRTGAEILDALIDNTDELPPNKAALKTLWREIL